MSDSSEGAVKGLGVFSTLQAATEVRFFLLSSAFVLLVDNVFLSLHQPGIFEIAGSYDLMAKSNLAIKIILILVGFSFLTSIALPLVAAFVDEVYIAMFGSAQVSLGMYLRRLLGREDDSYRRPFNNVSLNELRVEAHATKESYFLALYARYEEEISDHRDKLTKFALFAFYCLSMLCWNYYLSFSQGSAISVVFARYFGSPLYVWVPIAGLLFMFLYRFFRTETYYWVYCPSLYEKLTEQKNMRG
ncbi:hypothetical protein N5B55_03180 [Ralstonia pickettii]|uniref:hypothetical protein n=1 Tax=Ralstonia pickettii TaxID=329 RepID=UPI0027145913|nr:hypothetical protein [Ralstonia pickettii]WKZ85973.1 hypothetical protein N5B55_03180 [Ralstonia pickettii]